MKHSFDTKKQYFKLSLNRTSPFPFKLYQFQTPLNQVYFTLDILLSLLFIEIHSFQQPIFLYKTFFCFWRVRHFLFGIAILSDRRRESILFAQTRINFYYFRGFFSLVIRAWDPFILLDDFSCGNNNYVFKDLLWSRIEVNFFLIHFLRREIRLCSFWLEAIGLMKMSNSLIRNYKVTFRMIYKEFEES